MVYKCPLFTRFILSCISVRVSKIQPNKYIVSLYDFVFLVYADTLHAIHLMLASRPRFDHTESYKPSRNVRWAINESGGVNSECYRNVDGLGVPGSRSGATISNDEVARLILATVMLGLGENCCAAFQARSKATSKTNSDRRCDKKWERNLAHERRWRKDKKKSTWRRIANNRYR